MTCFGPHSTAFISGLGRFRRVCLFDTLMDGLAPGGRLVWSFNDHALADPANEAKLQDHLDTNRARLLFREHGPHLPGIGLNSCVYVAEKL